MHDAAEVLALRQTVEELHGCKAKYRDQTLVTERINGKVFWEAVVHVFDLMYHPSASIAYAWSEPVPGSENRQFYAVLHGGPVKSPKDAVRASIAHAYRDAKGSSN